MTGETETVRISMAKLAGIVLGEKVEYAASSSSNFFITDQALGATPTLYIELTGSDGKPVERLWLDHVRHYLDMTTGDGTPTYRLYLLEDAQADNVRNQSDVVFDSAATKAEATAYEYDWHGKGSPGAVTTAEYQLPKLVKLASPGRLYYMIDWTTIGAASSVQGYIKVRGRPLNS